MPDTYYAKHKEYIKQRSKLYRQEHREELRQKARLRWERTRGKLLARRKEKYLIVKAEVLTYYGGGRCACVKCGESRLACLSIDHIDGGGKEHLRRVGSVYSWLKRNNYPKGFQTLCMNCQWIKRCMNNAREGSGRPWSWQYGYGGKNA